MLYFRLLFARNIQSIYIHLVAILLIFHCVEMIPSNEPENSTATSAEEEPEDESTVSSASIMTTFRQESMQPSTSQLFSSTISSSNNENSTSTAGNGIFYPSRKERPPKTEEEIILRVPQAPLGTTASGSPVKPTKYHYYPHNQHIYLLPECAVQQVCNAVYVRLNYTQPLCACPSRYREPCSASLNSDDLHTTELSTDPKNKVLTLVKTCEPVSEMRLCRNPRDWSLLALQNVRTGKSHYLVICRCPDSSVLEGPMSHDQPTYASVPGIRVYGMVCINKLATSTSSPVTPSKRKARPMRQSRTVPPPDVTFPWNKVHELMKYVL